MITDKQIERYLNDLAQRFPQNKSDYYLSYSGGKDSHFLYWFIKEYLHDNEIVIVGVNTYMEHPQILKRIKENSDVVLLPEKNLLRLKINTVFLVLVKSKMRLLDVFRMEVVLPL